MAGGQGAGRAQSRACAVVITSAPAALWVLNDLNPGQFASAFRASHLDQTMRGHPRQRCRASLPAPVLPPPMRVASPRVVDFRGVRGAFFAPRAPCLSPFPAGLGLSGSAVGRAGVARPRRGRGCKHDSPLAAPAPVWFPVGAWATVGPRPWCPFPPVGGAPGRGAAPHGVRFPRGAPPLLSGPRLVRAGVRVAGSGSPPSTTSRWG